jgi:type IV pilus assembly protein PilA
MHLFHAVTRVLLWSLSETKPRKERERKKEVHMLRKIAKGFTLIELMIVVAIIGILAAIAIPNFVKFQCRSKQSEAKTNLKAMFTAQESYRAEFDTYWALTTTQAATTNEIGFTPKGQKIRYSYAAAATTNGFTSTATGSNDVSGDTWQIYETNNLFMTVNACD